MKKIFVTGATGNQGSATVLELLDHGFDVTALTRNPNSPEAQHLKNKGAHLLQGDLENIDALRPTLQTIDGLYLVLPPVWISSKETDEQEAAMGIQILEVAKECGVNFVVYSSVMASDKQATFRPKFKFSIEQYLWASGLKGVVLRPASFMENLLLPSFGLGEGKFINPLPEDRAIPYVATKDIGTFARIVFQNPKQFEGKTIDLGSDLYTPKQILQLLESKLNQSIEFIEVPQELLYQQSKTFAQLVEMIEKEGYDPIDYSLINQWMPSLTTFDQWMDEVGTKNIRALQHKTSNISKQ
ncbi:NmrA/HSCARG family protein [Olivibacter sp. 47]|uniref:NmrA/HSCARG family protein n=1 Tax=Olivibacter sp. 47 TaxID=3056486 RepID=UPI0025A32CB8|nr:NmrA/HSCARG family protein [Olivibacter sp. 47]MDM8173213.1 NmrA/HSCARG family protein [Olivibacter sp. 47]